VSGSGAIILPQKNRDEVPVKQRSEVISLEAGTAVRAGTGKETAAQPEDTEPVAVDGPTSRLLAGMGWELQ